MEGKQVAGIVGGGIGVCFGILCLIAVLLIVILIPLSVRTVRYDEYAILHNTITRTIDNSKVYTPGRYWTGVGYEFIKVPRVYQSIDFSSQVSGADGPSLSARTKDGLAVSVEVSFQYRLKPEDVLQLFDRFALNYQTSILNVARDAVRDTASKFTAIEFFENRTIVGETMQSDLTEELANIFIYLEFFQLRGVQLPTQYENIIEQKEISRQLIIKASLEQLVTSVTTDTDVMVAKKQAEITLVNAAAAAYQTETLASGTAEKINVEAAAQATAYAQLKQESTLNTTDVLKVMWMHTLRQYHADAKYVVDLKKPAILNLGN